MLSSLRKGVVSSLVLLYPYLVYRGIQSGVVWLGPSVLATILFVQAVKENQPKSRYVKLACSILLILGMVFFQNVTAKLLPTLIQLYLMYFFYKTLEKGPPLIERFVRLEFEELPDGVQKYCRQLTLLWTGFFGFNALMCSALAIWGAPEWWAIYTGVLIFVLTGLLMLGEYIFRHFRFPNMEIPDFKSSARNMLSYSRKIWLDARAGS